MLESVAPIVDDIVLVCAPEDKVATESHISPSLDARLYVREFDNFAAQRNYSFSKCKYDHVLWLDSDDVVVDADALRETFDDSPGHAVLYMSYQYEFDADGACVLDQLRERIVPRKLGQWRGEIHEAWCTYDEVDSVGAKVPQHSYVKHDLVKDSVESAAKRKRNLDALEKHVRESENPDRRLVLQYAMALMGEQEFAAAKVVLAGFIKTEPRGWGRLRALLLLAGCHQAERAWERVEYACMMAAAEVPGALEPYVRMFQASFAQGRYGEALFWFEHAYEAGQRDHDKVMWDPRIFKPDYRAAALAALQVSNSDLAKMYARKAGRPEVVKEIEDIVRQATDLESYLRMTQGMDEEVQREFVAHLPEEYHEYPPIQRLLHVPKLEGVNGLSIAIHCGDEHLNFGKTWGPESLKEGIGGSEEAVARLAPLLVERGAHVEVYGPWTHTRVEDGVHYIRHECWDPRREVDVFIAWRYPQLCTAGIGAKKRVLWAHDVLDAPRFKGVQSVIDEVWVLSQFHEDVIKEAWEFAPTWRSANGIRDMNEVASLDALQSTKEPHRFIYASSPDRGLNFVLEWWPEIRKAIPDATLHVYYGFNANWMKNEAARPDLRALREYCEDRFEALKSQGVTYHGNVSQDRLDRDMTKSRVWLYPTNWPEISCITAMKMQALGVIPIVARTGAIDETVQSGVKFGSVRETKMQDEKDAFIQACKDAVDGKVDPPDAAHFNEYYQWSKVADQWIGHLTVDAGVEV